MNSKEKLAIYLVFVLGISVFLFGLVSLLNNNSINGKVIGTSSCMDSDRGINYFVGGFVQTPKGSLYDSCYNNTYLREYSCVSESYTSTDYVCPFGCSNGACITCYDSSVNDSDASIKVEDEYCSSNGNGLYEAYCKSNATVGYALEACSTGTKCYDGACVSCFDSDGVNYTTAGIVWNGSYSFNQGVPDSCLDNGLLNEFSCSGDKIVNQTKNCSFEFSEGYNCQEGACVCAPDWQYLDCSSDETGVWDDSNNCGYAHEITGCDSNSNGIEWSSGVSFFDKNDISIGGSDFDNSENYTDIGVKTVKLNYKNNNIQFEWDFSRPLNLQNVNVTGADSTDPWDYVIVSNLSVSNKTIFIDRLNDSDSVCIIDENNVLSSDFNSYCNGTNEVLVSCPGVDNVTNPKYHCELSNNATKFKVWPLAHSAVAEWYTGINTRNYCSSDLEYGNWTDCSCTNCDNGIQYRNVTDLNHCLPDYVENQSCGECVPNWDCPNWESVSCVNGEKTRVCTDSNSCGVETNKPAETLPCTTGGKNALPLILVILGGIILVALVLYLLMHKRDKEGSNAPQNYASPKPPVSPQTRVYTPNPVR